MLAQCSAHIVIKTIVIFKWIFKCHLPHPATFTSYSHPRPEGSKEPHPIYILLESPSQNKKKWRAKKAPPEGHVAVGCSRKMLLHPTDLGCRFFCILVIFGTRMHILVLIPKPAVENSGCTLSMLGEHSKYTLRTHWYVLNVF